MRRYVFNKAKALHQTDPRIPNSVYVKSLERCHAQTVYDNWDYNYTTSVDDIAEEIDQLPTAGLFLKETDQLVSWIMYHPPNGMSRLNTLKEHRRRGYAMIVIRYMSKQMAHQSGHVPFVNIERSNVSSIRVFEKLGFRLAHLKNQLFLLPPSYICLEA